ncbi:MAG: TolC family outer membrane protein [Woeseiaceae bacterium]|nr:TolC family outer membrane protein [Woeseiaceae bacterium]
MKKVISIIALCLMFAALAVPLRSDAATLLEIYQQALQSDPRIHEAEARRLAALESKPQARGAYLPQVSFFGTYDTVTQESSSDQTFPGTGTITSTQDSDADDTFWQLQLRQTLFRWDQIVGLRQADKTVAKAEADREAAQQDLIVRVTEAYFNVLAAEDQLLAIHANRNAIARQLEQAKQRFEVGLIAITDVQESQAAYDSAVADEIGAKRRLATAREFLREITGEYINELAAPGEKLPLNNPNPNTEAAWIDLALSQNLALVSARIDEELARDEISSRRSGHYPTIDLVARTFENESVGDRRSDFNTDPTIFVPVESNFKEDSIGIEFSLPLFSGGSTSSRVKEAVYQHRAAREVLQRVTRETERQTRDAYLGVLSEISRVNALERAVESNQTALQATQAGFDVGTRTIVDVLNAQFQLYQAMTNFRQSRYDYLLNVMRLKQAAGNLQVQDLEALEPFLVERRSPEQVFRDEEAAASGSTP